MAKADNKSISNEDTNEHIVDAEYSAQEFADNVFSVFGRDVSPDCVIAAFSVAGVKKATKTEAESIVSKFMKKEVK